MLHSEITFRVPIPMLKNCLFIDGALTNFIIFLLHTMKLGLPFLMHIPHCLFVVNPGIYSVAPFLHCCSIMTAASCLTLPILQVMCNF